MMGSGTRHTSHLNQPEIRPIIVDRDGLATAVLKEIWTDVIHYVYNLKFMRFNKIYKKKIYQF